jgi:hypothetical protein
MCAAHHIMDIDPTEQGEVFYCADCGHNWHPDLAAAPLEPAPRQPIARVAPIDPLAFIS